MSDSSQSSTLRVIVDPSQAVSGSATAERAIKSMGDQADDSAKRLENFVNRLGKSSTWFTDLISNSMDVMKRWSLYITGAMIYALDKLLERMIDVNVTYNSFIATMTMVRGSAQSAKEEFKYLTDYSNRMGASVEDSSKVYLKLAAALKEVDKSGQSARHVFEAVAQAQSVLHLKGYETNGIFLALEQIVSKGKLSLEEIQKQLGNRLPDAMGISARAMEMTQQEFRKSITAGSIAPLEFVLKLANQIKSEYGSAAKEAAEMFNGQVMRMKNAIFGLYVAIGQAGAMDGLTKVVQSISNLLNDENVGKQFGESLGKMFSGIADWISKITSSDIKDFFDSVGGSLSILVDFVRDLGDAFTDTSEKGGSGMINFMDSLSGLVLFVTDSLLTLIALIRSIPLGLQAVYYDIRVMEKQLQIIRPDSYNDELKELQRRRDSATELSSKNDDIIMANDNSPSVKAYKAKTELFMRLRKEREEALTPPVSPFLGSSTKFDPYNFGSPILDFSNLGRQMTSEEFYGPAKKPLGGMLSKYQLDTLAAGGPSAPGKTTGSGKGPKDVFSSESAALIKIQALEVAKYNDAMKGLIDSENSNLNTLNAKIAADKRYADLSSGKLNQLRSLAMAADAETSRTEKAVEKIREAEKAQADLFRTTDNSIKSLDDEIASRTVHNSEIGKTKAELDLLRSSKLLESAATDKQAASELMYNILTGKTSATMFRQVAQLEELAKKKEKLADVHTQGNKLEIDEEAKKSLKESEDYISSMLDPTKVDRFSQALKSGIKGAAGAFIPLINAFDVFQAKQATLIKFQAENNKLVLAGKKTEAQATQEYISKEVQYKLASYGDMAGAAKSFFKENSEGYKAMAAVEQIFRATELANAVTSFVVKSGFIEGLTALFVTNKSIEAGADTTATVSSVINSGVRATADGVAGVAKAIASMPFPLNLAAGAATFAALMSLGVKMTGGVGNGSVDMTKQRQESAGTGSVLGDSKAKSDSLNKSFELSTKIMQNQLSHTISMDNSLKAISNNMQGLTNVVIKSGSLDLASSGIKTGSTQLLGKYTTPIGTVAGGVGGAAAGAYYGMAAGSVGGPIGMAIGAVIGTVIGAALSKLTKATTTLLDQGITGSSQSVGDIRSNGLSASSYADVNTVKKFLGITYSNKTTQTTSALPKEVTDQFAMVITSLADSVKIASGAIGISGDEFNAKLNSFVVDIGNISTKGMTGEQIQKQFETIFSKIGDDMAKSAVEGLSEFQKQGEGAYETLIRIAVGLTNVNDMLNSVGMKMLDVSTAGLKASDNLINLYGGLDKLTAGVNYFAENFLTDAERLAPTQALLTKRMTDLGYGSIKTVDEFKNLVIGLDRTNASQASLFVELLKLAPAFKEVATSAASSLGSLNEANAAVRSANDTYKSAMMALSNGLNDLAQKSQAANQAELAVKDKISQAFFTAQDEVEAAKQKLTDINKQVAESLRTFSTNLMSFASGLNGIKSAKSYGNSEKALYRTAEFAMGNDTSAQGRLIDVAKQFLDNSKSSRTSSVDYLRDESKVKNLMNSVATKASTMADMLSPLVNPMIEANKDLLKAQQKLADYAALAAATGSNIDKSTATNAESTTALFLEFKKAREDNLKAKLDYDTAKQVTQGLPLPSTSTDNGFMTLLNEAIKSKSDLLNAQNELSKAVIKAAEESKTPTDDFIKSLGLSAENAKLLAAALDGSKLSADGFKTLMDLTGLPATDLATALTNSGTSASNMAIFLANAGTEGTNLATRLANSHTDINSFTEALRNSGTRADALKTIFGNNITDATKFSNDLIATAGGSIAFKDELDKAKISPADFATALGKAKLSSDGFKELLDLTGLSVAALTLALGSNDKGLQESVTYSGVSLVNFSKFANEAGMTVTNFDKMLSNNGLDAESFNGLKELTNSDAGLLAGYINSAATSGSDLTTKIDGFKSAADLFVSLMDKLSLNDEGMGIDDFNSAVDSTALDMANLSMSDSGFGIDTFSGAAVSTASKMNGLSLTSSGLGLDTIKSAAMSMANIMATFQLPVIPTPTYPTSSSGNTGLPNDTTGPNLPGSNPSTGTSPIVEMVNGWYRNNVNAIKNPALADVQYWADEIMSKGFTSAKTAFANSVAMTTGTEPINITKFALGGSFTNGVVSKPTMFNIGEMGEDGTEMIFPATNVGGSLGVKAIAPNNRELLQVAKETLDAVVKLEDAIISAGLGNITATKKVHELLKEFAEGTQSLHTVQGEE